MEFNDYQNLSKNTQLDLDDELLNLAYYSMGIAGETGELVDKLKKVIRDDQGKISVEKRELIKLEMGDVLWYLSQVAAKLGISMEEVAQGNLEKLKSRVERGKLMGDGDTK